MRRDPTRAELSDAERILLGYLHRHCRGVARARTYARLREDLAALGLEVGEREMYGLVADSVLAGRLVGTCAAGAFIIMDARDARIAYRYLYGRVCKQLRRCRAFKRTVREAMTRQQYLNLAAKDRGAAAQGRAAGEQSLLFGGLATGSRT